MVYRIAMVWKPIIFTFCLIKSWSHDQSEYTNIFCNKLKEREKEREREIERERERERQTERERI